jgi:hypothetical protein
MGLLDLFGAGNEGGGILGGIGRSLRDAAPVMSAYGRGEDMGMAQLRSQQMQARRQQQQEEEFQKQAAASLAQKMGLPPELPPESVFSLARSMKLAEDERKHRQGPAAPDIIRKLQAAGVPRDQWQKYVIADIEGKGGAGGGDFGLNPVYGVGEDGNPVIMQMNKQGGVAPAQLPPGVKLSKEPIKLDAGTHFVLLDPITRQQVGVIPKDSAGAARETAIGRAEGEATASAPKDFANSQQMLDVIEGVEKEPGLDYALGPAAAAPIIYGTPQANADAKLKQLEGKAFLQAFETLKGGGQITQIEGEKATAAIARLQRSQSPAAFREALRDLKNVVRAAAERQRKAGGIATPQVNPTDLKKKYGLE